MNSLKEVTPSRTSASISSRSAGVDLAHDHVEAVVDRRPCPRPSPSTFPSAWRSVCAALLDREVDDRRRAAERRGDRAGLEVVGRRRAAERHVEVRVDVDAAGDHVLARRVDRAVGLDRSRGPRRSARSSRLDEDVAAVEVGRGDDRAALDQRVLPMSASSRQLADEVLVRVRPAVAEELPRAAHFLDHVEVERRDDELVLVLRPDREEVPARARAGTSSRSGRRRRTSSSRPRWTSTRSRKSAASGSSSATGARRPTGPWRRWRLEGADPRRHRRHGDRLLPGRRSHRGREDRGDRHDASRPRRPHDRRDRQVRPAGRHRRAHAPRHAVWRDDVVRRLRDRARARRPTAARRASSTSPSRRRASRCAKASTAGTPRPRARRPSTTAST